VVCCAFAAFLISQIIFALDWLREWAGMTQPDAVRANPASLWRLGAPIELSPPRRLGERFNLALAGGLFAFGVLASATLYMSADPHRWGALAVICTSHGLERIVAPSS
jgi:hypothetical protein